MIIMKFSITFARKFSVLALVACALPACAHLHADQPLLITIQEGHVLHTVPPRFHGTNFVALWNPTGDTPATERAFAQLGAKLVRFPGGVPCQWYDWKNPMATGWTTITPQTAWHLSKAGQGAMVFQTNTAANVSTIKGVKGHFDSSGAHMAEWVRQAKQQGIPVAYWEIGNEPEMDAPEKLKSNQEEVYRWYNTIYTEQATAIRRADPTARIAGPAATNVWYWWTQHNLDKFLKAHGNKSGDGLADVISLHWYPNGGEGAWEKMRGAAQDWQGCWDYIQGAIRQYDSRPMPVIITEWNWGGGDKNTSNPQLANALGNADCIGMFVRTGVSAHTHFCLQKIEKNWGVLASKQDSKPENAASLTFYALSIASRLGGEVLSLRSDSDEKNQLSAYATRKGSLVQVMLINKTPQPQNVALRFDKIQTSGKAVKVYTMEGDKGRLNDTEARYNGVKSPLPSQGALPAPKKITLGKGGTYMTAPYSLSLLEFAQ